MTPGQWFPTTLIILDLAAAVVYGLVEPDLRRCLYWVSAAVLTACVTF